MATTDDRMTVRAQAKWVRTSARKARLVLEHIRGRSVPEARTILAFTQRAAATDIEKVLRSAVANAEANHGLDGDELVVEAAYADEGPTLKRWKPRARGRVNRIRKRTCHVTSCSSTAAATPARPAAATPPGRRDEAEGTKKEAVALMGQKVHPGGFRVGVIHDWKSNWWTGKPEFAAYLLEDVPHSRAHPQEALARGAVGHPHPQGQAADHRRHLHGAAGDRDRQVGRRGGRAPARAARDHEEERPHQHQRDQASRARREARRAVDRRAAREPGELPARDEALARVGHALGRAGHQDQGRRPARRRRDEPPRDVLGGPRAAAHDPRGHRLRAGRGQDDLRRHRRQGLDQQGRDHAGGLRGARRPRQQARRPGSGAPPTRCLVGRARCFPRERPPRPGSRGSRHRVAPAQGSASRGRPGRRRARTP